ncbi:hypothetical protein [Larkinella humicola]|uniref:hypothetical protein n=1 Tax=Larkinella humicola TaxID=2607654 RepID=UPI0017825373|nr:hypothetical protein [Larkinella humicola]
MSRNNEASRRIAAAILFSRRKVPVVQKQYSCILTQQHQGAADQLSPLPVAGKDGGNG